MVDNCFAITFECANKQHRCLYVQVNMVMVIQCHINDQKTFVFVAVLFFLQIKVKVSAIKVNLCSYLIYKVFFVLLLLQ